MFGKRSMLGLAVEEGAIRVAEVRRGGRGPEVLRAAEFVPSDGVSFDEPTELGGALREFLLQHGFGARRCVVGLPASWLMARECRVPPAGREAVAGILRIQAERDFGSALADLTVDCVDRLDAAQKRPALLVATLGRHLQQVLAVGRAAGLRVRAVTASSLALASALQGPGSKAALVLRVAPAGVELTVQVGAQPRLLTHLRGEAVPEEVHRAVALLPEDSWWARPEFVRVVDGGALDGWEALGERLGLPVRAREGLRALGIEDAGLGGQGGSSRFAAAAALARAGLLPEGPPVDFLHSHLTPRPATGPRKRFTRLAGLGAALVAAGVLLLLDWQAQGREVEALHERKAAMADDVAEARRVIETTASARGWYDRRPAFLDCLRQLALAFPEQGRIWATSLTVRENMHGIVSGKAVDERTVLEVLDRLKGAASLKDVKLLDLHETQGSSRDVAFAMGFTFTDTE